jgi:5-formyltetrahydrofolate cyclo-ligase
MDLQKEKSRLRQELKNRRESLSLTQRETAAQEAQLKISQLAEWKNSQVVCLYASFKGELPTTQIIQNILKLKKHCVLPKVNNQGEPELYLVKNFQDLELSSLEILEPNKNCRANCTKQN